MTLDHRDALDRLADLALEPARLAGLATDPSPGAARLRAHIAGCEPCRAELAAWTMLSEAVRESFAERRTERLAPGAVAAPGAVDTMPTDLPAGLRERTLEEVSHLASPAGEPPAVGVPPRRLRRPGFVAAWLVAAAAVVVALVSGTLAFRTGSELDQLRAQTRGLQDVAASVDRVLADPTHSVAVLRTADGTAAGTIAWSRSEIVVVTTGLATPSADVHYRCWVENASTRTPIGRMEFSGSTGYWAGTLDRYGAEITPTSRFGVSIEPPAGSSGGGTVLLVTEG